MRKWLDNWRGVGDVVTGMARQDYDLELTRFNGRGWRATFFVTGMEHSITNATGSAFGADAVARRAGGGVGGRYTAS
jgi:hypothetical protein